MDDILETLEALRNSISERDAEKSFEIATALLLQLSDMYGIRSEIMRKLFPPLELLKNDIKAHRFNDAYATVLALLVKFRQVQELAATDEPDSDRAH